MASVPVYDIAKKKVGTVELRDEIFGGVVKAHLLNDAVRAQIAWRYAEKTANSRTRTEVHGTRKKMYKQKGTGQARHGDAKAPIFVGGGKAHGPRPRFVNHKLNKKAKRAALISALSQKHKEDCLFVVDKLEIEKPSAKAVAKCLKSFGFEKALFINSSNEGAAGTFNRSARNVGGIKILRPEGVNVFDLLKHKNLVVSKTAIEQITERLSRV